MNVLYPRLPRSRLPAYVGVTAFGALLAGAFGALHDQVSYTIGPEYFTRLKFEQFAWADAGLPPRAFAAVIGFLASWWVGLIGGWILARVGLVDASGAVVARAFALAFGLGAVGGLVGWALGVIATRGDLGGWEDSLADLGLTDVRSFVIVAFMHDGTYAGAAVGVIVAAVYVRRAIQSPPGGAPAMSDLTFDDIRPLFGLRLDDPAVVALLARLPGHRVGKPSDGEQYVVCREAGLDLLFRPPGGPQGGRTKGLRVLTCAFLFRRGEERHEGFAAPPLGVTFADTREALVAKLGEPFTSSRSVGLDTLCWEKWQVGGLEIHAAYDVATGTTRVFTVGPAEGGAIG